MPTPTAIPAEVLIARLCQAARETGEKRWSKAQFDAYAQSKGWRECSRDFDEVFPTFPHALRDAGLTLTKGRAPNWSGRVLEQLFQQAVKDLGRVNKRLGQPEYDDYAEAHKLPLSHEVVYHYGTWHAACRAARCHPFARFRLSDEECLAPIRRISLKLGHAPSVKEAEELRAPGEPHPRSTLMRLGGWDIVLDRAAEQPELTA
jgi:hypothetical protein